jgi:hypothetical protein
MMFLRYLLGLFLIIGCASAERAIAQTADVEDTQRQRSSRPMWPENIREEMLVRQRQKREERDRKELLKNVEDALKLSRQLETSLAENSELSRSQQERLGSLEGLVLKIRKSLGGGEGDASDWEEEERPLDRKDALSKLLSTTEKLVDEIKKTSKFTVSAVAIQTSNYVLQIVRFLKLRR